jgi:hypothetical protein
MTAATAAMSAGRAREATTVLATATRLGARYRPTWPLAFLVIPLIVLSTALSVAQTNAWIAMVRPDGSFIDDPIRVDSLVTLSLAMGGAFLAGLVVWSLWIALVVANVPALTARWPPNSPIGAFFAVFIPFIGLKRPYSVMRGVLSILADGRVVAPLLALAWWLLLLATYFAPSAVLFLRPSGRPMLTALASALEMRLVLLVIAAVISIALVVAVEQLQRAARIRREFVVLAAER